MGLALRADFLKEALPYCVDPDSFMVMDPLRRKVCLAALERARSKALAHVRLGSLREMETALGALLTKALEGFVRRLVDPALCSYKVDDRVFFCCVSKKTVLVDERVVPAHSVVSIPLDHALPGLLADGLDCGIFPSPGERS